MKTRTDFLLAMWPWASYIIFLNLMKKKKKVGEVIITVMKLNETRHIKYTALQLSE